MEFVEKLKQHLNKKGALVSVAQGKNKLTKKDAFKNKFNWTYDEIVAEFNSLENFLKELPKRGFTNGAIMGFRFDHGTSTRVDAQTKLNFGPEYDNPPITNNNNHTQTSMGSPENNNRPQPSGALGYTQVPQYEFINLKVQEQRHADIVRQLSQAEKDRDQAQSDLRIEKEKAWDLERKLSMVEEKWEMKLERIQNSNKKFFETEAGKQAIEAIKEIGGQLAGAMLAKGSPQAVGMGNPMADLPAIKQELINAVIELNEEETNALNQTAKALKLEGFLDYLTQFVAQAFTEIPK